LRKIEIDLEAIASNYKILKELSATKVLAIVKADAFGHGKFEVAKKLESIGVDMLGTADIDEALELRAAGIKAPMMAWLHGKDTDFTQAIEQNIDIGLAAEGHLDRVLEAAATLGKEARLHLKVDSGLGRNGAALKDWPDLIRKALQASRDGRAKLVGVFSHLSGTSEKDDLEQLRVFQEAVELAESLGARFELRHLAASLATLRYPQTRLDMVRVGLALYGLDPDPQTSARTFGLRPAMRVSSEVVSLKRVPSGHGVSYGYLYRTEKETTLALVPFGYAEGLPRIATGKAEVLLNGSRYKILARIAMDQFVLDVGDDAAALGDEVVIIGDGAKGEPTAEQLATASETINYEIVTRMGGRAKRVFK
jgi:alanine racemase